MVTLVTFWITGTLPSRGLDDVTGIVSATMFRNTVSDSNIVTPGNIYFNNNIVYTFIVQWSYFNMYLIFPPKRNGKEFKPKADSEKEWERT